MVDEQEKLLPIANVGRIMKQILPPRGKISREAKQTMQDCTTEFISFVTGEAYDNCRKENRKIVSGDDICLLVLQGLKKLKGRQLITKPKLLQAATKSTNLENIRQKNVELQAVFLQSRELLRRDKVLLQNHREKHCF